MSKLLKDWTPSKAAIELLKLNGLDNEKIRNAEQYLKSQSELNSIDDVKGYDSWDSFFILFGVKTNKSSE